MKTKLSKKRRERLSLLKTMTSLLTLVILFTLPAFGQSTGTTIDVGDNSTAVGTGWTYASNVFTISNDANVTITGTTTTNRIVVNGTATITLNGVSVTVVSNPFVLNPGADVTLYLADGTVNTFYASGGAGGAGIQTTNATLIINGTGSLDVTGAQSCAGIGGISGGAGGTVTITGGTITANSQPVGLSTCGAPIGGGINAAGGDVTISGGTVRAIAPPQYVGVGGIGHGTNGSGGTITITGGSVFTLSGLQIQPTNGNGASVFRNTLTVGNPQVTKSPITAGSLDGVAMNLIPDAANGVYGINGVSTDESGKLYFYLPLNTDASANVLVTTGGDDYFWHYSRNTSTQTQTLLKEAPAGISGSTTMTLIEGYAATSTDSYTLTGNRLPTVTKTSGHASINWNNSTNKLEIAAGLTAGSYPVELKASNGVGADATLTFTLTVKEQPDFTISGDAGYTYSGGVLTITANGTYAIGLRSGVTTATDRIVVNSSVTANITLNGVSIDRSADNSGALSG